MKLESIELHIPIIRDGDGEPTCSNPANVLYSNCMFLSTSYNALPLCNLGTSITLHGKTACGNIKPHKACKLLEGKCD